MLQRGLSIVLAGVVCLSIVRAQELEGKERRYEFFSGNVSELSQASLTVSRAVLGRAPRTRSFRLTPETKIEGDLKPECRVTVAFVTAQDGAVAKRIIVRHPHKKHRGSEPEAKRR